MMNAKKLAREEFEKGIMEHLHSLYTAAFRFTRNEAEAEDLVQDTYVKALRFQSKFEWGTNLKAWLLKILTNTFLNRYRKSQRARRFQETAESDPVYDAFFERSSEGYSENPEKHVFNRFFLERLEDALAELPEEFRAAVVLSDIEELSYKEMADILECPIGTVMSRLHRGRQILKRMLVDFAVEEDLVKNGVPETGKDRVVDLASRREKQRGGAS